MQVTLKSSTPLENVVDAIRICWDSGNKKDSIYLKDEFILGARDKALIERVIKEGHTSTLEHKVYTFFIKDLPRFVLIELERHRLMSMSCKSSRYTLKELKEETRFWWIDEGSKKYDFKRASKYIYLSDKEHLNKKAIEELEFVREEIVRGTPNDEVKQILPECYLCDLYITINSRSLLNLLGLRSSNRALKQIRELAHGAYNQIPEQEKFIYSNVMKGI